MTLKVTQVLNQNSFKYVSELSCEDWLIWFFLFWERVWSTTFLLHCGCRLQGKMFVDLIETYLAYHKNLKNNLKVNLRHVWRNHRYRCRVNKLLNIEQVSEWFINVKLKKFSAISWLEQDDDDVLFVLQQQPC
jgi:hypothetical protein